MHRLDWLDARARRPIVRITIVLPHPRAAESATEPLQRLTGALHRPLDGAPHFVANCRAVDVERENARHHAHCVATDHEWPVPARKIGGARGAESYVMIPAVGVHAQVDVVPGTQASDLTLEPAHAGVANETLARIVSSQA